MFWLISGVLMCTLVAVATNSNDWTADWSPSLLTVFTSQPDETDPEMVKLRQRLSDEMAKQLAALQSVMTHSMTLAVAAPDATAAPSVASETTNGTRATTQTAATHSVATNERLRSKRENLHYTEPQGSTAVGLLSGTNSLQERWRLGVAAGAQHIHVFSDRQQLYALAAFGNGTTDAALLQLQGDEWQLRQWFNSLGTLHFTSFTLNASTYIIGAEYDCALNRMDKRGPILYHFYNGTLQYRHALPEQYPTDVEIWQHYDVTYIGVASYLGESDDPALHVKPNGHHHRHLLQHRATSSVFKWSDGNFESLQFVGTGVRDIEHFSIHSHRYLAVANFVDDLGNHNIHSAILRHNLASGKYETFQQFRTYGAVRMRHFHWGQGVGEEHFLVVANQLSKGVYDKTASYEVNSVVYKFHGNQFLPFQCIRTTRAQDVLSVWGADSSEFALIFVDAVGLKVYQYTGWRFVLVKTVATASGNSQHWKPSPAPTIALATFTLDAATYLTVGSAEFSDNIPTIYRLNFERQDDLARIRRRLSEACSGAEQIVSRLDDRLQNYTLLAESAPKLHDNITLHTLMLEEAAGAVLKHISTDQVHLSNDVTLSADLLGRINEMTGRVNSSVTRLQDIDRRLTQAVRTNESHSFSGVVHSLGAVTFTNVSIDRLNATRLNSIEHLPDFLANTVYLDESRNISHHLKFSNVHIGSKLEVGLLNGTILPGDLLTTTGKHNINGTLVVNGSVLARDVHSTAVNDRLIDSNNVIVQGKLPDGIDTFTVISADRVLCDTINNINVSQVLNSAILNNETQFPACSFHGPLQVGELNTPVLNGHRLSNVNEYALAANKSQVVSAQWTIDRLSVESLRLSGTLNGVRVPGHVIPIADPAAQYNVSQLHFGTAAPPPHFDRLHVTNTLGPINVKDGRLQLLLNSLQQQQRQHVTGAKHIDLLIVTERLTTSGTVNSLNISSDMVQQTVLQQASTIVGDRVIVGNITFNDAVTVTGLFNNYSLAETFSQYLALNDTNQPNIKCSGDVVFEAGVYTDLINGISPSDFLRSDRASQQVTASTFLGQLTVNGSIVFDTVNGVDLDHVIAAALTTDTNQTVTGPVHFTERLIVNSSVHAGNITWAGYNFSDLVTTQSHNVITGEKTYLQNLTVSGLKAVSLYSEGPIDSVDIAQLLDEANNHTRSFLTEGGVRNFTRTVTTTHLWLDPADAANGSSSGSNQLLQLLQAAQTTHIGSDIVFGGSVHVENLEFSNEFDGVSSAVFGRDWLTSSGDQVFTDGAHLKSVANISTGAITAASGTTVNGQPFEALFDDYIKLADMSDVVLNGDVYIDELHAPFLHSDQLADTFAHIVRTDSVNTFPHTVNFSGSVEMQHLLASHINDIDIDKLCNSTVFNTDSVFESITLHGDLHLNRTDQFSTLVVNGLNLATLEQDYLLKDANQTVSAAITLQSATFSNVDNQLLFLGTESTRVDLASLLKNYWSRTRTHTITGDIFINGDLIVDHLTAENALVTGYLNGVNIDHLFGNTLTTQGCVVKGNWSIGSLLVTDQLSTPTLNGVDPDVLVDISGDRIVIPETDLNIDNLYVRDNMTFSGQGTYKGYDISAVLSEDKYLTRGGRHVINCSVLFTQPVQFEKPLSIQSTVNNVTISRDTLLTRQGDQKVSGHVTLAPGDSSGCVRADIQADHVNYDLTRAAEHAVRTHGASYKVTGEWKFVASPHVDLQLPLDNATARAVEQIRSETGATLALLKHLNSGDGSHYLSSVLPAYHSLAAARGAAGRARYLQYFQPSQRWSESRLTALLPLPIAPAEHTTLLAAIATHSVQLLHWHTFNGSGVWTDGARYPDLSAVSAAAALQVSSGAVFIAFGRLRVASSSTTNSTSSSTNSSANTTNQFAVHRWSPAGGSAARDVNYIYRYYRGQLNQFQYLAAAKTVDVKAIVVTRAVNCFLFVNYLSTQSPLVCYSTTAKQFQLHQTIPTEGAREASVFSAPGATSCVAVTGSAAVDIWCWSPAPGALVRRQSLPALTPLSVATAHFHRRLVLSVVHAATVKLPALVDVYSYDTNSSRFVHVQTIGSQLLGGGSNGGGGSAISVRLLVLPSDQLLLVTLTRLGRVLYLSYAGHSWFRPAGHFSAYGATSLEVLSAPAGVSQLAVAGLPPASMFSSESTVHPSSVYTAKFLGDDPH